MPRGVSRTGFRRQRKYASSCLCGCGLPAVKGRRFHQGHKKKWNPPTGGLCPCGCGERVLFGKKFASSGCASRGRRLNLSAKERRARSGRMRRQRRSSEFSRRLLQSTNRKPWMAERNRRFDIRRKVSLHRRGKRAGPDHPFFGKSRPDHAEKIRGEKNWNWKGGAGGKYPPEFSEALKRRIKRRDGYKCRKCDRSSSPDRRLEVHHTDHNRRNNDESNLVTLCQPCHLAHHLRGEAI